MYRPLKTFQEELLVSDITVSWRLACRTDEVGEEDVLPFEHNGRQYAIYHTASGFYATDGLCTHEEETLADGVVIGEIIECPRHQGRFDIRSGKAKGAPVCVDLRTYPTRVDEGLVYIGLPN
jgi:3-phenylpropionate/trans-cinnamate dioxygenase ferredoxin subunit